ncbi:glycosyl transferase [bacterium]|nr:glycosyl transferase [bacterium]
MNIYFTIITLIGCTIFCILLSNIVRPLLEKYLMREPINRDSHIIPTPRGGGIIFVLIVFIFSLITYSQTFSTRSLIILISTPIAFVGLIDDFINLNISMRFLSQGLTGLALIIASPLYSNYLVENYQPTYLFFSYLVFLVLSVIAIINFVNFMDGIDGLVTGVMIVIFFTMASQGYYELFPLVGSLMGFLFLNWSPAKVFMGDTGSTFLGALFFGSVLQFEDWRISLEFIIIATPLFADAAICVLRRFVNGQLIFSPHKLHLYQRLNSAGWSHSKISVLYILASLLLVIGSIFGNIIILILIAFTELALGYYLDQHVAVRFLNKE